MQPGTVQPLLLGIDLGATFVKLGLVTTAGQALDKARTPLTDWTADGVLDLLFKCSDDLLRQAQKTWDDVAAIGIGSPGHIKGGRVVAASNFPEWRDFPLAERFQTLTGKPTSLVNDADAAISAAVWVGAARGRLNAVMLTTSCPVLRILPSALRLYDTAALGSGVGSGVVLNGHVFSGSRGLVEAGHMIVVPDGRPCGCGQKGCLETYASANSVAARATEALQAAAAEASTLRAVLAEKGAITAKDVFEAAERDQDTVACSIVDETAEMLALGCVNICRMLDPEVIIFAGGMAEAGDFLLNKVRGAYQRRGWTILENEVEMVVAQLGPDAGLIGAAACARFLLP